jgi:cobalt-precorrin 5A hydrolase
VTGLPAGFRTAVYALTAQGLTLGHKIKEGLQAGDIPADLFGPRRLLQAGSDFRPYDRLADLFRETFGQYPAHAVIGALGLTVRTIAPLLGHKQSDPAVVGLGQDGRFIVSLLSGHLGGANRLAQRIALITGGQAVITTATDLTDKPALEVLAREAGLAVENWPKLAAAARTLAEGQLLPVWDPFGFLTESLRSWPDCFGPGSAETAGPGLWIDYRTVPAAPPDFLIFRPPVLAVGLGGHRQIAPEELSELLEKTLAEHCLAVKSVKLLATIDRRAGEKAFRELAEKLAVPLLAFGPDELAAVETPNPSAAVLKNIGVSSVCEACALLGARTDQLLIPKQKSKTATCAAALIPWT